jgi:hypothetical protein
VKFLTGLRFGIGEINEINQWKDSFLGDQKDYDFPFPNPQYFRFSNIHSNFPRAARTNPIIMEIFFEMSGSFGWLIK